MSTTPSQEPTRGSPEAAAFEMEAVAKQLVALVDEFEVALGQGHVPPAFAERLAQLRQSAERLNLTRR